MKMSKSEMKSLSFKKFLLVIWNKWLKEIKS